MKFFWLLCACAAFYSFKIFACEESWGGKRIAFNKQDLSGLKRRRLTLTEIFSCYANKDVQEVKRIPGLQVMMARLDAQLLQIDEKEVLTFITMRNDYTKFLNKYGKQQSTNENERLIELAQIIAQEVEQEITEIERIEREHEQRLNKCLMKKNKN